jgi:O-antigen/teichoic acid export membrane protein
MTGTTIAQAIPIAITPILTRIYTPQDFGILTLYISLAAVFSVIATLRYELAIVQPLKDEDASALVILSIIIASSLSILLSIGIFVFNHDITTIIAKPEIGPWLYLLPISVFLTGIYQSLDYWNTRIKEYKKIAFTRITQGTATSGAQIGMGAYSINGGLIWGILAGQFLASLVLLLKILKRDKNIFRIVTKDRIIINAKQYKKFPLYSTIGAFADTASLQMPIFILSSFYSIGITGVFSLTFRALNLPMSLISKSLSQVLFQKISHMRNHNPQDIFYMIVKIFLALLLLMTPCMFFIHYFGGSFFSIVFGEQWDQAGKYAEILIFAVAIRFAVSPLSIVLAMDHNVKLGVIWQIIYLVTITITLYIFRSQNIGIFVNAFVLHELALYTLYFAFILKGAKHIKGI